MAVIDRSARVPYGADQMLALVNDINTYPKFLHWCHAARVERAEGLTVDAALEIGISGIYKTIRTRNTTRPAAEQQPATIRIEMLDETAYAIQVRGEEQLSVSRIRDVHGQVIDAEGLDVEGDFVERSEDVMHDGAKIGDVRLYLSKQYLENELPPKR